MDYHVLILTVADAINWKIYIGSISKAMPDGLKKRGRWFTKFENLKNTKIWVSRKWKELFRWNKNHFSEFLKGYHLVRNKNLIKNSRHKLWIMAETHSDSNFSKGSISFPWMQNCWLPFICLILYSPRNCFLCGVIKT